MATFLAIVMVLGATTLVFTRWQRDTFKQTASDFEHKLGIFAELQREIVEAEVPIGGVLYELDHDAPLDDQWRAFGQHNLLVRQNLAELEHHLSGEDLNRAARVTAAWQKVSEGVAAARAMWGTGEVSEALARGEDPFSPTVWASLREVQAELAVLGVDAVRELRAHSAMADRRQRAVEPLLLVVMAAALALTAESGRRLSRRVVRPLMMLRTGAARVRDGDLHTRIDVGGSSSREVWELARVMNDMAVSLNRTHGRLRDQAYTDGLTGLANRRALTEHLEETFPKAGADTLALLLIDLDDFKFVNDSMGHAGGDKLLVAIAGRLRSATRDGDLVARLGGDEFAVVVHAHDVLATATLVAERILGSLDDVIDIEGTPVRSACSIGIATGAPRCQTPADLVREADAAMYMAKSRGKHCLDVFDGTMHTAAVERVELKAELARAVERDQLELHYQPVIDLVTDEVLGFEALVRWRHPKRGLVPPMEFIPIAEETGDIVSIGEWVLMRACEDLATYGSVWVQAGREPWIAVNVSGRQIAAPGLIQAVRAALSRYDIAPHSLMLEITEGALLSDTEHARKVLDELRRDGVRVAIDDFGTGFSSLRYLHELPVDCIKIDRSFVASNTEDARAVILETIVSMGRGLGLHIVAEGIELESERERLKKLGPMAGQGYLIARPMPAAEALQPIAVA